MEDVVEREGIDQIINQDNATQSWSVLTALAQFRMGMHSPTSCLIKMFETNDIMYVDCYFIITE